jgi:hypothetical protein
LVERLRLTNEILRRNCIVDEQLVNMISNIQKMLPPEMMGGSASEQSLDDALADLKVAMGDHPLKEEAAEALKPKDGTPGGRRLRS